MARTISRGSWQYKGEKVGKLENILVNRHNALTCTKNWWINNRIQTLVFGQEVSLQQKERKVTSLFPPFLIHLSQKESSKSKWKLAGFSGAVPNTLTHGALSLK